MDVAQDFVVSTILEGSAQRTSVLQILEGDCPVPSEPKMDEHKILGEYRSGRTTEVERERILDGTEIMEFENEIFREEVFRTPDDPTNANWRKTELICSMTLSTQRVCLTENLRPDVLMDTTLLILKSHSNFGVANGAMKPPEAAST